MSAYSEATTLDTTDSGARLDVRLGIADALPATTVLTLDGGLGSGSGRNLRLFNDESVEILRGDGKAFSIPLERLSAEDREYLKIYCDTDKLPISVPPPFHPLGG